MFQSVTKLSDAKVPALQAWYNCISIEMQLPEMTQYISATPPQRLALDSKEIIDLFRISRFYPVPNNARYQHVKLICGFVVNCIFSELRLVQNTNSAMGLSSSGQTKASNEIEASGLGKGMHQGMSMSWKEIFSVKAREERCGHWNQQLEWQDRYIWLWRFQLFGLHWMNQLGVLPSLLIDCTVRGGLCLL